MNTYEVWMRALSDSTEDPMMVNISNDKERALNLRDQWNAETHPAHAQEFFVMEVITTRVEVTE